LIAKVIATAATRDEATIRLVCALRAFPILGVQTNIPFLLRILEHPRFSAGEIDTAFLDHDGASLATATSAGVPDAVRAVLDMVSGVRATVGGVASSPAPATLDPWEALTSWRR